MDQKIRMLAFPETNSNRSSSDMFPESCDYIDYLCLVTSMVQLQETNCNYNRKIREYQVR
jgi:hypothetical protein